MDFSLTSEQQPLVDNAARFARERLATGYRERERAGCVPRELARELGALGLLGAELPEAVGGMSVDCLTSGLLLEQVAYADFNVAYVNLLASLCGQIVANYAQPEVVREWLPEVVAGRALIALALTEPSAGSDAARLKLKAVRDGDDFVLSGEKASISMATQADVVVVFARTGSEADGAKVIQRRRALGVPGVRCLKKTKEQPLVDFERGEVFFGAAVWHRGFHPISAL
jgi:cyclohexanecarboxyl-CoA dehydrogenase